MKKILIQIIAFPLIPVISIFILAYIFKILNVFYILIPIYILVFLPIIINVIEYKNKIHEKLSLFKTIIISIVSFSISTFTYYIIWGIDSGYIFNPDTETIIIFKYIFVIGLILTLIGLNISYRNKNE